MHPLKSYAIRGSNTDWKTYPSDYNHQGEYTLDTFKFTTNTTVGIEFYRYIQLFYDSSMMEMTLATSRDTDLQKTVFFSGSETQYKCSYYTKDGYQFNKIELYKGNEQQQIFLYSSYFNFTPNDNYDYKICGYAKAQETPTYSINITRP